LGGDGLPSDVTVPDAYKFLFSQEHASWTSNLAFPLIPAGRQRLRTRHQSTTKPYRYVYAPDPDALAAEFLDHGAAFSAPLEDTHDGLRGFELTDPDGYVLFFGRPR
jgi:hypothetical protein